MSTYRIREHNLPFFGLKDDGLFSFYLNEVGTHLLNVIHENKLVHGHTHVRGEE